MLLFFSHSAYWLPTRKKLLYTVANPARGLLNRERWGGELESQPCMMYITIKKSIMYGHTYSKSMDQPCKVANPARGQLNRENEYSPVRVRA